MAVKNPSAPEVITTAFTDNRHVCMYVNEYYAYTLCDGVEREDACKLFLTNDLPTKRGAAEHLKQSDGLHVPGPSGTS